MPDEFDSAAIAEREGAKSITRIETRHRLISDYTLTSPPSSYSSSHTLTYTYVTLIHLHLSLIIPSLFLHVGHPLVTSPCMRLIHNHLLFLRLLTKIRLRIPLFLLSLLQFIHRSIRSIYIVLS